MPADCPLFLLLPGHRVLLQHAADKLIKPQQAKQGEGSRLVSGAKMSGRAAGEGMVPTRQRSSRCATAQAHSHQLSCSLRRPTETQGARCSCRADHRAPRPLPPAITPGLTPLNRNSPEGMRMLLYSAANLQYTSRGHMASGKLVHVPGGSTITESPKPTAAGETRSCVVGTEHNLSCLGVATSTECHASTGRVHQAQCSKPSGSDLRFASGPDAGRLDNGRLR